jgi:hypothetical protein
MSGAGYVIVAHIAGIPVEETLLSIVPVFGVGGWAYLRGWAERRRTARAVVAWRRGGARRASALADRTTPQGARQGKNRA